MIGRKRSRQASRIASSGVAALALRIERDVDHHDRVLLDDADQHQDADDRDDARGRCPNSSSAPSAPTAADGRPVRMVSGWMKLS